MRRLSLVVLLASCFGCRHVPTDKELQGAQIHYDLGVQLQQNGDPQGAFREYTQATELDPRFAEAHNAMGVLLHWSFKRYAEAIRHYERALEIRPAFSEAKTNLANVYLEEKRYDDAIILYEAALNDMLYPTPFIANGNLGWALYMKGNTPRAIEHIKMALTANPKFCLGYKSLGQIYDDQGKGDDACRQYGKFRENCPDAPEALYRDGLCLAKQGKAAAARQAFEACEGKAGDGLRDDCRRLKEQVGP